MGNQAAQLPTLPPAALYSQSFDELLQQNGVNLAALDGYTEQAAQETSGNRTVGNPELSLGGGVNSPNDPVIFGLDAYRQATDAGHTYRLETSTSLQSWTPLHTGLSTNTTTIAPPNVSTEPRRYYRIAAE